MVFVHSYVAFCFQPFAGDNNAKCNQIACGNRAGFDHKRARLG